MVNHWFSARPPGLRAPAWSTRPFPWLSESARLPRGDTRACGCCLPLGWCQRQWPPGGYGDPGWRCWSLHRGPFFHRFQRENLHETICKRFWAGNQRRKTMLHCCTIQWQLHPLSSRPGRTQAAPQLPPTHQLENRPFSSLGYNGGRLSR